MCMYSCNYRETVMTETPKPIGYWFKHIDKTLEANFAALLATEQLRRRHWQILHTLAGGALTAGALDQAVAPFLDAEDPTAAPYVATLTERGWIVADDTGRYALTAPGVEAHARLLALIQSQRTAVTAGLTEDDYRELLKLLQRIAANVDAFALTLS